MDKEHGRIETRELWSVPTDPQEMGLAGVAQVVRIHCHAQLVRRGQIIKETDDTRFAVTTFWPEEAGPDPLLEIGRDHWSIENGQYYRRDRTQDRGSLSGASDLRRAESFPLSLFGHLRVQAASGQKGRQKIAA